MKKRILRFASIALAAVLIVLTVPTDSAFAALSEVKAPAQVTTFKSTTDFEKEYVRAYVTDDTVLKINYKTPLEATLFRVSLYRVGADKGDINLDIFVDAKQSAASDGTTLYGFTYYLDVEQFDVPDGYYNLYLRRCATAADAETLNYKSSGVLYKNMEIKVTDGKVKILRYKDVIEYNNSIKDIGALYSTDRYLDNTLEDIRFVLRNPATDVYAEMTPSKIAYIQRISDRVTQGAYTNYDKLLKIYEYTAKNFYYDSVAFSTHSYQYADPYDNIYNYENGLSSANSVFGRVHTTCQGFSAIYLALARAQGIPTRFVYGHRLAIPSNDWLTEDNIDVRDHWWTETYVNGKWIFVDPTVGTTNKYNKNTGAWTYTGLTNYTYFDASDEQVATSHVYMNIYPDYRAGKYIDDTYEMEKLRTFFNQRVGDSNQTNGSVMNSSYSDYDTATWGDGTKSHFMTNGRGKTAQIQWSYKGFTGPLNLSGFTKMTLLSSHDNKYEAADLSGSPVLKSVYLYNNSLTSIDLSSCYKLSYVRAQNNPMKNLKLYVNGRNRSFTAGDNGTFCFTLDTSYKNSSLSLYSDPDIGYKLGGVYSTGTGNRLSTKTTYHFTPKAVGYSIRFVLNPDSYKYYLNVGESRSSRLPYIRAAAKRLNALGYYNQTAVGEEDSYTEALAEAVTKFQVMHDLSNNGAIGKKTWSNLFNNSANTMVSDEEYEQILADYEVRQAQRKEAEALVKNLTPVAASAKDAKKNVKVTLELDEQDNEIINQLKGMGCTVKYRFYRSEGNRSSYKAMVTKETPYYTNTSGKNGKKYFYRAQVIVCDKTGKLIANTEPEQCRYTSVVWSKK